MSLPPNLITGVAAKLPTDWKKQPTTIRGAARSVLEEGFLCLLRSLFPELPQPEREFRFAPPRRWRFDFAWPAVMLAVEIEGMAYGGGRHQRRDGFNADAEKYRAATELGWYLLRFSGDDLRQAPVQCIEQTARIFRSLTN